MWGVKGESCEGVRGGGGGGGGRGAGVSWESLTASSISDSFKPVKNIFLNIIILFSRTFLSEEGFLLVQRTAQHSWVVEKFYCHVNLGTAGATILRLKSWKERF